MLQVGELYLIQCLALLTHREVIPEALITPSIALFMFVITIIGGNVPLLVTLFTSIVGYDSPVQLSFEAQSQYTGDPTVGKSLTNRLTWYRRRLIAEINCFDALSEIFVV